MKRFQVTFTAVRLATRIGACALICILSGLVLLKVGQLLNLGSPVSVGGDATPQPSLLGLSPVTSDIATGYWTFAGWDWEMSPPRVLNIGTAGEEPPISESILSFESIDQDDRLIQSLVALKARCVHKGTRSRYSLVQGDFQLFVDTSASGGRTGIGEAFFRYQDSSDATWREVAIRRTKPTQTQNRQISLPLPSRTVLACSRISNEGKVTAILATALSVNRSLVETWRGLGYTVEEQPDGLVCSRNDEIFLLWCPPKWRDQEICLIQVTGEGKELLK